LEQAVEGMWPDTQLGRERDRFWTALGNLRSVLRTATGVGQLKAIQRDGLRYRVDRELFAVDLWRFQAAVATARRADLDSAVAAALAEAGDAYSGPLLDGAPYAWVEISREDLRRQAVDALARLAELHQGASDRQRALAALEQAIAVDPVAEELYRRLMRLEAELGRPDAVQRTYRLLARHLAELDVDPYLETEQLVADLLRRPGAYVDHPGPLPPPGGPVAGQERLGHSRRVGSHGADCAERHRPLVTDMRLVWWYRYGREDRSDGAPWMSRGLGCRAPRREGADRCKGHVTASEPPLRSS
jgi:DNA-binding SARP family transcriptional activator